MLNKHPYFKRVEKESLDHVLEIFYKTKECVNIAKLKKYASRSLSPQRAPKGEIELVINNEEIDPVMKPLGMMLHQLEHSFRSLTDQLKLPNKKNLLTTLTSLYQLLPPNQTSLSHVYKVLSTISHKEVKHNMTVTVMETEKWIL